MGYYNPDTDSWVEDDSSGNIFTDENINPDIPGTNPGAINLEGGDLGQTEAQAQDDFYRSIGLDPATIKDMPPADKAAVDAMINGSSFQGDSSLINSIKGFFKKPDGSYDWAKIAGAGAAAAGAFGIGSKKTAGGWEGPIPTYTASRQQIQYNDPNRRPGAQGRQYFTDVNYSGASTAPQAEGIMAAYQTAQAQAPKWNAANAVATPWAKPAAPAPVPAAPPARQVSSLEQELAKLQAQREPVKAATGRYLQGSTDGMADKINTSIDGQQPAKLSHGEFVVPADVVSHLGNGNSDAGARRLYQMMDKVRQARTGTKKQGKQINPDKYMPGGTVNKYASGGIAALATKKFATGGPATDTTTTTTLSPWAGDYVGSMLGKGRALAESPYQAYKGPLTAGPSDLQQQQFAGLSNVAQTGLAPTQYTTGTFGTEQAAQYMNPYLEASLRPQMEEMRRQAQINLQPSMAKLTQAGGFGGGRQAIMESEAARNLLAEQNKTLGQGYATAYDKAMQQFNAEQNRGLQTQQAQQAANEASAQFGLKSLQELGQAGAVQRGIESEGITADKAQFEEQRDWPYKMVQYQQGLLQGLPITTQANTQNMSGITQLLSSLGYGGQLMDTINKLSGNPSTATKSPGTT